MKSGGIMLAGLLLAANLAAAAPSATPHPMPVADGFTFTAGGNMIGPYHDPKPKDPGFFKGVALLQNADLGFANQEGSIFDLKTFRVFPRRRMAAAIPSAIVFRAHLKAMGISLVSKANNHATDWGTEGLAATLGWLAAAGVTQAGAGRAWRPRARPPISKPSKAGSRWSIPLRPFRPWRWRDRR